MQSTSIIIFYSNYQKEHKTNQYIRTVNPFSIQFGSPVITLTTAYWDVMTCIWVDKVPAFR